MAEEMRDHNQSRVCPGNSDPLFKENAEQEFFVTWITEGCAVSVSSNDLSQYYMSILVHDNHTLNANGLIKA